MIFKNCVLIVLLSSIFLPFVGSTNFILGSEEVVQLLQPKSQGFNVFTPHNSIFIDGNSDFSTQAEREGWSGVGTATDPYIIESYIIQPNRSYSGIKIINTNLHFIIRNCLITNISSGQGIEFEDIHFGLVMENQIESPSLSSNGRYGILQRGCNDTRIIKNKVNNFRAGITILESHNITVAGNIVENSSHGLEISWGLHVRGPTTNVYVWNNTVRNCNTGFFITSGENITVFQNRVYNVTHSDEFSSGFIVVGSDNNVTNNIVEGGTAYGMYSWESYNSSFVNNSIRSVSSGIIFESWGSAGTVFNNNQFLNNSITQCSDGILLNSSDNTIIEGNLLSGNTRDGLMITGNQNTIINNSFIENGRYGLNIGGEDLLVHHNQFKSNGQQVYIIDGVIVWTNGTHGNYWSDYSGIDFGGDGVGDNPYVIQDKVIDPHPLVQTTSTSKAETTTSAPTTSSKTSTTPSFTLTPFLVVFGLVFVFSRRHLRN